MVPKASKARKAKGIGTSSSTHASRLHSDEAPQLQALLDDDYTLPDHYGFAFLRLTSRDPFSLHAYWETGSSKRRRSPAQLVLRVHDITESSRERPRYTFDVEVGEVQSKYLNLWTDNATYFGEIGWKLPDGSFERIARSNITSTPASTASKRSEVVWMERKGETLVPFVVLPEQQSTSAVKQEQANNDRGRKTEHPPLTTEEIRAYYAKLFSSHVPRVPLALLPGPSTDYAPVSAEPLNLDRKESSETAAEDTITSFPGASEKITHLSSFMFQLDTELVVYGRATPGSTIVWGDQKIEVKEDGSFALRLAFPQGTIPLSFTALSPDGSQQKTITPSATRADTTESRSGLSDS